VLGPPMPVVVHGVRPRRATVGPPLSKGRASGDD
jgi:hypothetical protein